MGSWEIVAAILGVATIVMGGVVSIFTTNARSSKRLSEGSGLKRLPPPSDSHRNDIERMARLETQVKNHGREMGEVKASISKLSDKVTKLGDLVIEWIQSGGRK